MAEVILSIVLAVTFVKTVFVADAAFCSGTGVRNIVQTVQTICSRTSEQPSEAATTPGSIPPRGASGSKTKSLHRWLLGMHVTTIIAQGALVAKNVWPVSDTSCVVTRRTAQVFSVLFDATMVMFLLAKAHVVADRTLAWWEKIIIWWSRLFACVYLTLTAAFLGVMLPMSANPAVGGWFISPIFREGRCVNGFSGRLLTFNLLLFSIHKILLVIEGVLLLGMFFRPLLGRAQGMQSGGSFYRGVVLRNVICTVGIVIVYAVRTIVVRNSARSNHIGRDFIRAFTGLATLLVTEIALPIGFTSLVKAFSKENPRGGSTTSLSTGGIMRSRDAVASTRTQSTKAKAAVSLNELLPETP